MSIHLTSQLEFAVKAQSGEETLEESVQQPLVKLVVDTASVNRLGHQSLQSRPRDLVGRDILTALEMQTAFVVRADSKVYQSIVTTRGFLLLCFGYSLLH